MFDQENTNLKLAQHYLEKIKKKKRKSKKNEENATMARYTLLLLYVRKLVCL